MINNYMGGGTDIYIHQHYMLLNTENKYYLMMCCTFKAELDWTRPPWSHQPKSGSLKNEDLRNPLKGSSGSCGLLNL